MSEPKFKQWDWVRLTFGANGIAAGTVGRIDRICDDGQYVFRQHGYPFTMARVLEVSLEPCDPPAKPEPVRFPVGSKAIIECEVVAAGGPYREVALVGELPVQRCTVGLDHLKPVPATLEALQAETNRLIREQLDRETKAELEAQARQFEARIREAAAWLRHYAGQVRAGRCSPVDISDNLLAMADQDLFTPTPDA